MEYKMTIHNAKDKLPLKSGTYLVKTSKYFNLWQVLSYSAKFKKFNTYDSQDNDKDAIGGYMWAELPGEDSEVERVTCPDCNGSGVCQEYDENDRYYVYACGKCEGTGEILHQSIINEEGHFPLQAEQEYNKLFEDKCIKTGVNLVDIFYPPSDDAVQNAKTTVEKKYDGFRSHNIQGDCYKYVCSCSNCGQMLWEVEDYNYGKGEKGYIPNYCPNCGRKLKGE